MNNEVVASPKEYILKTFEESEQARQEFLKSNFEKLIQASEWVSQAVQCHKKILICGNGGSAADAQHMAAEMIGRMIVERRPLAALALTTDSSNLTAIGNDYSFDAIFEKQVQGLGNEGDILIAISTSGNSKNVLKAVEAAKAKRMKVISLTGGTGGALKDLSDLNLNVALGKNASRVQESHIFAIHSIVDVMDRYFLK